MSRRADNLNRRSSAPVLRVLGAAETVTGSRFLLDTPTARVLFDCGLFQGLKALRLRNWQDFAVDPSSIDAVVLSHAHLDHSGYVPALVRNGFRGAIHATPTTSELCGIVLPDSGHVQEEDAAYANRKGYSKHTPALPLYTEDDAHRALKQLVQLPFGVASEVAKNVQVTFHPAGHILGSAITEVILDGAVGRKIVFSGDLGRPHHPILRPPAKCPTSDIVLVESTYGDREHEDVASIERFRDAILRTAQRGGMVVIPSFAVDRTEVVLFHLRRLMLEGLAPKLPVFVDSPMALATLQVYRNATKYGSSEINPALQNDDDPFDPGTLIEARRVEESMAINEQDGPGIIISASGMATGGRVLHHLMRRLTEPRNTVMLVGFQAEGTRGRALLDGARNLKLLGRYVAVRAEIVDVPAFSVHADRSEIIDWLRGAPRPPEVALVIHGEPKASRSLRDTIDQELGWNAAVPRYLEQVRLD
ncbi:MAG: MBL fold metallo-hydrolase [Deltaproteobacteria bacterium]|nr:MBL fold metallo-hydrolase [Deltaproteobacteria bacterium]